MAEDKRVTNLTELAAEPASGDILYIVDASEAAEVDKDKYIQASNLLLGPTTDIVTNATAIALNTTHRGSDGSDHSRVTDNETAIALNTTHRGSDGTDHGYIDQDVQIAATPTFGGVIIADGGTVGQAAGPLLTFDDTLNFLEITGCSIGVGLADPDTILHLQNAATGATEGPVIRLERNDTGISAGEIYGGIEFEGQDSTAGAEGVRARILGVAMDAWGATGITFSTRHTTADALTEHFRVGSQYAHFYYVADDDTFRIRDASTGAARIMSLENLSPTGESSIWQLSGKVADGTSTSLIRVHRETDTTGDAAFTIHKGDGSSTIEHYFGGNLDSYVSLANKLGVGITTGHAAKLHVDQSSSTGAIPVLLLDQGDVSEQCIQFSSDGTDRDINLFTVNVTGAPTMMWDESNDGLQWNKNLGLGIAPTAYLHLKAGTAAAGTAPVKLTSGTPLTVAEAGVLEYNGACLHFTQVVDRRCISLAADSIIASTVSTSTSETVIYTGTISAAELTAGKVLKVAAYGSFTTHDANDQVTIRIKLGTITVATLQSTAGTAETQPWHLWGAMTIRTIGAGGTVSGHAHIMMKTTETHTNTESTAINTTAANNITITAQWSDTSNSISIDQGYIEVLI